MKILLTNLPSESQVADNYTPKYIIDEFSTYPPLGLLYVAAGVPREHELEVLDTAARKLSVAETVDFICKKNPDLLGISVVTSRLYALYAISKEIKKKLPHIKIVAGGPHVNIFPVETLGFGSVDYVLKGDGEKTFPLLIKAVENNKEEELEAIPNLFFRSSKNSGIQATKPLKDEINLDSIPFPRRDLLDMSQYRTAADKVKMTTINSSRGCPYRCIFCDVQSKVYRYRSAENIVDEMQEIVKLGIREIHIFDDTFNIQRDRVIKMCREIMKRGLSINWGARARVHPLDEEMVSLMKASGCYRLHLGVESGNPKILEITGKKITIDQVKEAFRLCNKYKIEPLAYFIIGFPGETVKDALNTVNFIKSIKPAYVMASSLYPLPNTQFYKELLEKNIFSRDYWLDFARQPVPDYKLPLWREPELEKEIEKTLDYIYRRFYLSLRFIVNQIKTTRSIGQFLFKARLAFILLKGWLST